MSAAMIQPKLMLRIQMGIGSLFNYCVRDLLRKLFFLVIKTKEKFVFSKNYTFWS